MVWKIKDKYKLILIFFRTQFKIRLLPLLIDFNNFLLEKDQKEKIKHDKSVGVDMGYKKLISTSTGKFYGKELVNVIVKDKYYDSTDLTGLTKEEQKVAKYLLSASKIAKAVHPLLIKVAENNGLWSLSEVNEWKNWTKVYENLLVNSKENEN